MNTEAAGVMAYKTMRAAKRLPPPKGSGINKRLSSRNVAISYLTSNKTVLNDTVVL